jgi:N-[(2S)-2-amino-2-carboxyethyl]-L-glutamate dehydrogenase
MSGRKPFEFAIVPGTVVDEIIRADLNHVVELVSAAYRTHAAGQTVNPASMFLRFPERPNARIIALPAHLGGAAPVSGLKWIASFPDNVRNGRPRASAVLLLNDAETGYPFACLESSIISAARTAASATVAALALCGGNRRIESVAFVGAGIIARYVADFLIGTGWTTETVRIYDLVPSYAQSLGEHIAAAGWPRPLPATSVDEAIRDSQLVVFATTAGTPHVRDPALFKHAPRVLHISLRDLAPEILLGADNIVDDVDHCLTAETSPHLAERLTGNRRFVNGTLVDLLDARIRLDRRRAAIFSPFGLGVLDLAVGCYVYEQAAARNSTVPIDNFFHERSRW